MTRVTLLLLAVLLCGCAYTGQELRNAGAGGTRPAAEPAPETDKQDPRFQEPIRPGTGRVTVK